MNNNEKNNYKNKIIRRIAMEYVVTMLGFIFGLLLFVYLSHGLAQAIIWQPENPLYILLSFVKDYLVFFIMLCIFIGWAYITYRFMGRPLRYLDSVISASEKLANPNDEQIILPDELKDVQDEMNGVREDSLYNVRRAREAEQRKNDLIVYLAHDLKTPLTSVIGYLSLLKDEGEISKELREKYLSISLNKAERLEDLINEFFEITRFNLSHITLEYSKVNLTRLLEQLTFEFKPMLAEKNLECGLEIEADTMIMCDVDKIQRVFDNLLRNAVNYSFENEKINISCKVEEKNVYIKFSNKGNTIPKEKLNRIFEQFYRLDTARSSKSGGAGLGLAIAKEIVELHKGTIEAKSENEVIEFNVTLPIE